MTTQRDRLAALLDEVTDDILTELLYEDVDRYYEKVADALLARGVRVVDGLTLARAVHETVGSPMDDLTTSDMTSCRDVADRIVAALDAE